MAGRNYILSGALKLREAPLSREEPRRLSIVDDPRHLHRLPTAAAGGGRPNQAELLEDHLIAQRHKIQSLLSENERLLATHVALKQELSLAQKDLRRLKGAAMDIKVETDAQVRVVLERSLKMDAEARSIDAMTSDLANVRADIQKLGKVRQELTAQMQAIEEDIARIRPDTQQVMGIEAEIRSMHQEIQKGRAAIEYEKKMHSYNLEQSQAMEKSRFSMALEADKLRAELANIEKRERAAAAAAANPSPGYGANYGNPDISYGGCLYTDPYGNHQVPGGGEAMVQSQGSYEVQQNEDGPK